jgi:hypothetical protein
VASRFPRQWWPWQLRHSQDFGGTPGDSKQRDPTLLLKQASGHDETPWYNPSIGSMGALHGTMYDR